MDISYLASLRCLVGKLGEKENTDRWGSDFFSKSSTSFIKPVFPRTSLLAKCNGVSSAAALVHDERIGVGSVFHLFRLPEDIELEIHKQLQDSDFISDITPHLESTDATSSKLIEGAELDGVPEGPIVAGNISDMQQKESWQRIAKMYSCGFTKGKKVFPYFVGTGG